MTTKPAEDEVYYATVTSKGQITLPKDLREALHLEAGSRVKFVRSGETVTVVPATRRRRDFREAIGTLTLPQGMTVDEYISDMRHDPGDREILQSGPGVGKITYVEDLLRERQKE
ncbi:AbrB/MazE/SpoVT family DNA-binding domain-containing protein [Deinococcus apachensis]|uniref:AbrB/MazE/SpoVT family DNA-binding domain-containing protein n=1 Tax=Deinococcus apachensis TaxID=309886 RepID=UPI000367A846|nr:AbrB/MazE/SpoVT family DNA-binding domain-containing protein [Deinococcus apachensis]